MQEDKLKAISNAIKTNDNTKHKLTDEEVGSLFGRTTRRPDGTLVIESDYEDDEVEKGDEHQNATNGGEGCSIVRRSCEGSDSDSGSNSDSDSDSH